MQNILFKLLWPNSREAAQHGYQQSGRAAAVKDANPGRVGRGHIHVAHLRGQRRDFRLPVARCVLKAWCFASCPTIRLALFHCALLFAFFCSVRTLSAQADQTRVVNAKPPELSGTIVDISGATIAGATVEVRSANGTVERSTRSDTNGSYIISKLPSGKYLLVVSRRGFEAKEIPITIDTTEPPAPLGITLAVSSVSTSVNVQGREDDLVGVAESATQGTVGAQEIEDRPILRSGEVLETVPGLIITQHAGGGKANQYFLRGFNLDHGTDFAVFLDDMPLNLPSHAHGEGYADMNTVIPELVQRVNYEKGPYYADVGNFGSAGSAHLEFFKTLPENFFQVEGGMMAMGGPFSAYRKSSGRAVCCSVEKRITMTAHGRIRMVMPNSTACSPTAWATTPMASALRPAVTTENGTRAIRSPLQPYPWSVFWHSEPGRRRQFTALQFAG